MKRRRNSYVFKLMMIISALMLMTLLCGCRTRITNNTDVSSRLSDESGTLQELYQTRRDELGIPVAESPLFSGSDSDEDYEGDEDFDEGYEEYDDEGMTEEETDEETDEEYDDEEESGTTVTTTTPVTRPSQQHVVVRPSTPQTPTITYIRVTLNPNGKNARCTSTSVSVRKGYTYGALPTPTRADYEFQGWYTDKSKGNKVTSTTKVTKEKDHTLYAHWKKIEKKKYKITFDGNGEEDEVTLSNSEITVTEGGTYGKLPSAKREKYTFKGWYTDAEKGSQITADTKFTGTKNQTLYAHWEYEPYKWWKDEFDKSANGIDSSSQVDCLIDDDSDKAESFLNDCRIRKADSETDSAYIVKFIKNYDEEKAEQEAESIREKYSESAPDASIIIVSNDAIYGSKEVKLVYKMKLLDLVYGSGLNLDEAEYDLLDGASAGCSVF